MHFRNEFFSTLCHILYRNAINWNNKKTAQKHNQMFFHNLPSSFSWNKFLGKLHKQLDSIPPPQFPPEVQGSRYPKDVNNNGNNNRDVTATRRQKRLKEIRSPENVACTCNICSTQHAQYFQATLSSYNILWRITFSTDTEINTIN